MYLVTNKPLSDIVSTLARLFFFVLNFTKFNIKILGPNGIHFKDACMLTEKECHNIIGMFIL